MLVANDPYDLLRFTQPQHGSDEIAAIRAVKPRTSDHGRKGVRCQHSSFTGQFRCAVGVQRRGNVTFIVCIRLRAVEYIVGRMMNERDIHLPGDIRQCRRTIAVDAERLRRFRFGLVDRSICGRVDDCRGRDRRNELVDPRAALQIQFWAPERHHGQTAHCGKFTKTPCQLTVSAGNEDGLHHHLHLSVGRPGDRDESRHRRRAAYAPTTHDS